MKNMKRKCRQSLLITGICLGSTFSNIYAIETVSPIITCQTSEMLSIQGTILDKDGLPIIGANVVEKGTQNGVITDFDGKFSLNVNSGAILQVSFIGYVTQELKVTKDKTKLQFVLLEDTETLDEVVVVGYGVQKKKLVTGATVQVKGEDLQKMNTTSALGALQSQTPGVNITSKNGQPGEGFKVYVRGMGTIGNADPLYVIDGVAGGDINTLNPADIESIDVLKDAASAAIYGARAANGVILVTTKQGKSGKLQISYDGYVGKQYIYKMPELLNAQQYMQVQDQLAKNEGLDAINWQEMLPDYLYQAYKNGTNSGSNWFKEAYNEGAPLQNHVINLSGGSDVSKFSLGFSYTNQEGVLGAPCQSDYSRYTVRINSDHVLLKVKDFDAIKIGENLTFSVSSKSGIALGDIYSNDIFSYLSTNPLLPMYDSEGNYFDYNDMLSEGYKWNIDAGNPVARVALTGHGLNESKNYNLQASAFIQIQPIKNFILKSQFGYKFNTNSYRSYEKISHLGQKSNNTTESVTQNGGMGSSWTLDNTLSYQFNINKHNANIVIGNSLEKWGMGGSYSGSSKNTLFLNSWEHAWLGNTKPKSLNDVKVGGFPNDEGALASFFGRVNYDYKETYMASFTLRADGSSNFARGNRWGYFPSVSAGWVVTNEEWLSTTEFMDFLKLRASWGQNGNCNISNFQYYTTYALDEEYYFGTDKATPTVGAYAKILANPDVTWETSEQVDLGFDARFFNSRLNVNFDWYYKKTKDWLVQAPIMSIYGLQAPYINGGDVLNKGIELAFSWNDQLESGFRYGANLNVTYNKNEVTKINNSEGIIHGATGASGALGQGAYEIYRAQEGMPIGYFYGYKTEGIFQNEQEIKNWKDAGYGFLQSNPVPGDVKFSDLNKDGIINDKDKTDLGNPIPDYILGASFNCYYKGIDLSLNAMSALGHQVVKSYRNVAGTPYQNFTTEVFDYWNGEGTSNRFPRVTSGSHVNLSSFSSIYVEDADYLRLQNLTVGYDFKQLFSSIPLQQLRLYFTVQNLFTLTKYSGMDPEVGYGFSDSWSSGIDLGSYPTPRSYILGVNVKF